MDLQAAARHPRRPPAAARRLPGLPEALRPPDLAAARRLQDAVREQLSARLGPRIGWKIGCTTAVMQRFLGIRSPARAASSRPMSRTAPGRFPATAHHRIGVECEIAVRIGRDLPPGEHGHEARWRRRWNRCCRRSRWSTTATPISPRSARRPCWPTTSSRPAACWARRSPTGAAWTWPPCPAAMLVDGAEGRTRPRP